MRVALVAPGYGAAYGVVGRHVQELAEGIARNGGSVHVLLHAAHKRELPATNGRVSVSRFIPYVPGGDYAISRGLWSYLRRHAHEFDLLHAHGMASLPAIVAAPHAVRHLIFSPHFYASAQPRLRALVQGRVRGLSGRVLLGAERVLCVSESEAQQVRHYAPQANVRLVPNGFDTELIAHAQPYPVAQRVIVSVDRLTEWAGIRRIISALPALAPSYRLIVAGRGRGRGMLEEHAHYLGVADRVRFVGGVSDAALYRWLRTASVVATLKEESLWAGTLLMAACAGAPVVASDMPANREAAAMIGQEGIGLVSRRASPFVVADAVRELAGAGSRSRAELVPAWADTAERALAIYRDVLGAEHGDLAGAADSAFTRELRTA